MSVTIYRLCVDGDMENVYFTNQMCTCTDTKWLLNFFCRPLCMTMHTNVILTNKRRTHAQSNYTNTKLKAWG